MLAETGTYLLDVHEQQEARSRASANVIVPLAIQATSPRSVLDVGCGIGTWVAAFLEHGVSDCLGLDGEYALDGLRIPRHLFTATDLRQPLPLSRTFDLAVCLEVAEHLPADVGPRLVRDLTQAAPRILFSAAIPGQGGVGHINERPLSYWVRLFREHDYLPLDIIRPKIWYHEGIAWWYRQNVLLMVRAGLVPIGYTPPSMIDVVHPELHQQSLLHVNRPMGGSKALTHLLASVSRRLGLRPRSDSNPLSAKPS